MDREERTPVNFKTTKNRKRLGIALVAILNKSNLTEVVDLALDRLIDENISPDLRDQILRGNGRAASEESPPSGESKTRRSRSEKAA